MSSEGDRPTHAGRRFGPTLALIAAVFTMGGGAATIAGLPFGEGGPKPEDPDPFFERAGSSGYSADSYDVALDYEPRSNRLRGTVTMSARAQSGLDSFYVDMRRNLTLRDVTVNGSPAITERAERRAGSQDVKIVPDVGVPDGLPFEVVMRFAGRPESRGGTGWKQTSDGAVALNEPRGVPSWMPVNDDVRDKATFDWRLTVPKRLQAVANGRYEGREVDGRSATYSWTGDDPMSSYLSLVAIGRFDIRRSEVAGVPSWVAVDKGLPRSGDGVRALPRIQRYFTKIFGPYPFSSTGAMVDAMPFNYALETQTRSAFPGHPGDVLMAHELAHQWFGDSVGLERWPDMWLNEGFATWAQWRWVQHRGGEALGKRFRRICSIPERNGSIWRPAPNAIPRASELFANSVYIRGGMTLEALRQRIGRAEFGELLRRWASENRHGNVDTRQFESLAEEVSGEQLDGFFDDWLREAPKPADCRRGPAASSQREAGAAGGASAAAALPARLGRE